MIDESEFWSTTEELTLIHRWARARYAAPWAVFFAVLLRVSASVSPHVQLPGIIGGRASLNLLCAFVAPSGGGKGISDKVARLAWPAQIVELPIGSGEGIAETFTLRGKESSDNERVTNAIFNCPEIDILTGLESRQGSTILGTLKSFAMGEQLGSTNASKANSRNVPAHSYRGCLSVGAQPGHTGVIFNDVTGGTPQRLLWALTIDPTMPAEPTADPEPLNHHLPGLLTRRHDDPEIVTEIVYGPDEIRQAIIAAHLARQRGEGDALDGHWMLTRLKVAAVLAIMHHRTVVSEVDWQLSETVMAVSDRTRDWIVTEARQAARAKVRERAASRATFDEMVDDRHAKTVRSRILRLLTTGSMSRSELRRAMGKQHYREAFDAVLPHLLEVSQIVTIPGEKALHYALNPEFTGEPEFTPQITRSEAVNQKFTGEPPVAKTELDVPRSQENGQSRLSTREWMANHVADLLEAGHQTADSFAVLSAGEAAGHYRQSLIAETSKHPGMTIMSRRNGTTVWWIDPTQAPPQVWQPVGDWIASYVDVVADGAQIDRLDFKAQGMAEGYSWENLRKAIRDRPDIHTTHSGPNTEWRVRRTTESAS
ncbi:MULTISPECIES: hypothetical protein [Mycobacteriaceae]|uniref:DUF3987 domain-containing protein n=1 Tax=Mycolicibacterium neoaurum VKM Ac-1815D TaxID=700508 RepID=V5X748_MYCNE|nr:MULTISPECIES: hypothetical protein [Mycobacteriaceae]